MVRFFFHIKNDSTFEEEEGEKYPDLEATRAHAAKIAREQRDKPEPRKQLGFPRSSKWLNEPTVADHLPPEPSLCKAAQLAASPCHGVRFPCKKFYRPLPLDLCSAFPMCCLCRNLDPVQALAMSAYNRRSR